jgi:hypothetical protein
VSILLFYLRFAIEPAFRITAYVVMFIAAGYCAANAFVWAYICQPMALYWDWSMEGTCQDTGKAYISTSALNVATDIIILLLPIWLLWPLRVRPMQKLAVTVVLMAGGL